MLYVVAPWLTGAELEQGNRFVSELRDQLGELRPMYVASDRDLPPDEPPGPDDVIVVFNPSGQQAELGGTVGAFLNNAVEAHAELLTVQLDDDSAVPPSPLGPLPRVSFSVVDRLQSCAIAPSCIEDAARLFARVVRPQVQPTMSSERLALFLSHRWKDGKRLVASLDEALAKERHSPFRDVPDLPAGAGLVPAITAALEECDVLVLVDAPEARNSDWIRSETCLALGMGIPIVWVRIGPPVERPDLPVWPSDRPDVERTAIPTKRADVESLAKDIVRAAFDAAGVHTRRADTCRHRASRYGKVELLDARRQIFELVRPRPRLGRFAVRPERHVVQFFGRRPTTWTVNTLVDWLREHGFRPDEDERGRGFDVAVLMSPATGASTPLADTRSVVSTHGPGFVTALAPESSTGGASRQGPELLLLAAYPRGSGAGAEVGDAVHEVVTTWLARGGRIRFGGHPSVTHRVNFVAQHEVPGNERERVTIYQTLYFQTPDALREVAELATVVGTPSTGEGDAHREPSLRVIREQMILGSGAAAAIVIGGRTSEGGGHEPGIVVEVALARRAGIPCYILGSTGGQARLIIDEVRSAEIPWAGLGDALSAHNDAWLAGTEDYAGAVDMIWSAATS